MALVEHKLKFTPKDCPLKIAETIRSAMTYYCHDGMAIIIEINELDVVDALIGQSIGWHCPVHNAIEIIPILQLLKTYPANGSVSVEDSWSVYRQHSHSMYKMTFEMRGHVMVPLGVKIATKRSNAMWAKDWAIYLDERFYTPNSTPTINIVATLINQTEGKRVKLTFDPTNEILYENGNELPIINMAEIVCSAMKALESYFAKSTG